MRADLQVQWNKKASEIARALDEASTPYPLGHAFVWGSIPVSLKNGKTKYYKGVIASVCSSDLGKLCNIAESMGARNVFYNLD